MNAPQNFLEQNQPLAENEIEEFGPQRPHSRRWITKFFGEENQKAKMQAYTRTLVAGFVILGALEIAPFVNPGLQGFAAATTFFVLALGTIWVLYVNSLHDDELAAPLRKIARDMERLASGERNLSISGRRRKDEIGDLARVCDRFMQDYQRLDTVIVERDAAHELERGAAERRQRELLQMASEFETMIGQVAGSVATAASQLNDTAGAMAKSAHGSSETAQMVADAMTRASDSATAAAAASDEFALSIDEIAKQASQSEELARKAASATQGTDSTVSDLAASADEISHVVELIQSIASRTNLLALNASIEAARGGESGRGFAVVAAEVKELAAQTGKATDDVSAQIATMQANTATSVDELGKIASRISDLQSTAMAIAAAVDQQSVAGKELARSIDMSARETGEVAAHAGTLLTQATSVGASADQLLGSARELESQAGTLSAQASRFLSRIREG